MNNAVSTIDDEINLLEYLKIILKYKFLIFFFIIIGLVFGLVVYNFLPKVYKAETTFFMPADSSNAGSNSYLQMLGVSSASGTSMSTYLFMLLSTDLLKERIEQDLEKWFLEKNIPVEKRPKLKLDKLKLFAGSNGIYSLKYENENADVLLPVINGCLENFNILNIELELSAQKSFIKILDPATKPKNPEKESKIKVLGIAFVSSFFIAIVFIFILEFVNNLKLIKA